MHCFHLGFASYEEINSTSFSWVKIKQDAHTEWDNTFNSRTVVFNFHLLLLDILVMPDCMIENIFLTSHCNEARANFFQHGTSNSWKKAKYCSMGLWTQQGPSSSGKGQYTKVLLYVVGFSHHSSCIFNFYIGSHSHSTRIKTWNRFNMYIFFSHRKWGVLVSGLSPAAQKFKMDIQTHTGGTCGHL